MATINIHDAKANLSRLVDAAASGEEVIIAKAGRPAVRLVPVSSGKPVRRFGVLAGEVRIAQDFDAPLADEILATFEGR